MIRSIVIVFVSIQRAPAFAAQVLRKPQHPISDETRFGRLVFDICGNFGGAVCHGARKPTKLGVLTIGVRLYAWPLHLLLYFDIFSPTILWKEEVYRV